MPGIDLAALSGADLKRLLKVAHTRHDGLLSDRLEWEIAARAASGSIHTPTPFATLPEDDADEPAFRMTADDREFHPPDAAVAPEPAPQRRGAALVALGAVAGSVLSATVFWGLEKMDRPAASQPVMAAAPAAEPGTLTAAPVETIVTPQVEVAAVAPVQKPHRPKRARANRELAVASAGRGSRAPNLSEWLGGKPEEPIY